MIDYADGLRSSQHTLWSFTKACPVAPTSHRLLRTVRSEEVCSVGHGEAALASMSRLRPHVINPPSTTQYRVFASAAPVTAKT